MSESIIRTIDEFVNADVTRACQDTLPFKNYKDFDAVVAGELENYGGEFDITMTGLLRNISDYEVQVQSIKTQIQTIADANANEKRRLLVNELEANRKIMEKLVEERSLYIDTLNRFKTEASKKESTGDWHVDTTVNLMRDVVNKLLHVHGTSLKTMSNQYNASMTPTQLQEMPDAKLEEVVNGKLQILRQQLTRTLAEIDRCGEHVRKIQEIKDKLTQSLSILIKK